jgi:RelE toxin of RelE / RelB toxin-antitoxin system
LVSWGLCSRLHLLSRIQVEDWRRRMGSRSGCNDLATGRGGGSGTPPRGRGRKGRGKRGGLRVIYFYRSAADVVYFLDIYAKTEKADLTAADKQQLRELVNRLRGLQ